MMKRGILMLAAATLLSMPVLAKDGDKKKKKDAAKPATEAPAPAPKMEFKQGMLGVAQSGKDWFMNVPDSILGRPILAVTRFLAAPVGLGKYGGEEMNEVTIYFEKGKDGSMLVRTRISNTEVKADQAIAQSVRASNEDPIVAALKIEGREGQGSKVKVTSLFGEDLQVFGLDGRTKRSYNLGGFKKDASFINSIRTYPINTEITTTKTFSYNQPTPTPGQQSRTTSIPAGNESGVVTVQLNTSLLLLPKVPMQKRYVDQRVGYFADGYNWFSDDQQKVEQKRFITRYRLEPKNEEDAAKQRAGQLIEPKKQIVYYIDPATPKQWVPYLIAGVNDWNVAFEAAGWKNAIRGAEWPNDSTMSLEDARFSVIRYLASDIANAYGPNVHDPRSGEILESHVGWYHNVMTLVHDWYMLQAGAVDPRARKMKYDDELMGDLIRFVSSHEVGHTLGLRHNMGASNMTPVEKLRDKAWVEANGHTVSIMDYARFNYVAQPEDNIGKAGLYPRIGDYDKWAIKFGYSTALTKDEDEDHKYWNKVIMETLAKNPRLWFGGEGSDGDPRAQTEDLGDNSMKASEYGIKNLKRVLAAIPEWTKEEADMYTNCKRVYEQVINQYKRYMGHVARNIGGVFVNYKSVEQEGDVYSAVPKAQQKEALDFLNQYVFTKPSFLIDQPYIYKFSQSPSTYLNGIADGVVSASALLNVRNLARLQEFADKDASNYKPEEYLNDLYNMIFTELNNGKAVDTYRRHLQRQYVNVVISIVTNKNNANADARALLMAELLKIQKKAKASNTANAVTKAHWTDLAQLIDAALAAK